MPRFGFEFSTLFSIPPIGGPNPTRRMPQLIYPRLKSIQEQVREREIRAGGGQKLPDEAVSNGYELHHIYMTRFGPGFSTAIAKCVRSPCDAIESSMNLRRANFSSARR